MNDKLKEIASREGKSMKEKLRNDEAKK